MRSLRSRIEDIQRCKDCRIVQHEQFNEVIICFRCRCEEKEREARLKALSLDEFIREVVNGRAEVHEARNHSAELYEQYMEDMPYGTQKARTGDPDQWITERLLEEYGHLIEEEVYG